MELTERCRSFDPESSGLFLTESRTVSLSLDPRILCIRRRSVHARFRHNGDSRLSEGQELYPGPSVRVGGKKCPYEARREWGVASFPHPPQSRRLWLSSRRTWITPHWHVSCCYGRCAGPLLTCYP